MKVSYIGPSLVSKRSLVFRINGVDVTIGFEQSHLEAELIQLTEDSAPMLEKMLDALAKQLKANEDISDFFRLGYIAGLHLINACLHDEFIEYFIKRRAEYPYPNGKRQFMRFLNQIIGAKAVNFYIQQDMYLRKFPFYNELFIAYETALPSLEHVKNTPQYHNVSGEFTVEYHGYTENRLHVIYTIDGHEVFFPCKNKSVPHSTQELFDDCVHVKNALVNYQDIKPFIRKYGGKCAYKLLTIIGTNELLAYFDYKVHSNINERLPFYPRKIIKEYGFSPVLLTNEPCILLDFLEKLEEETLIKYTETNESEVLRDDVWRLFYREQGKLHWGLLDFTQFNKELRDEILSFMRAYYRLSNCEHLLHVYYSLSKCITFLGNPTSILNCKLSDATSLRASLTADKSLSVATIAQHIDNIAMFYDYTSIARTCSKPNPFDTVRVRSRSQYLNPTHPIGSDELKTILGNLALMPTHIQIAILILCETGARANEVCGVTVDDFSIESNGCPVLKITLQKNHVVCEKSGRAPFVQHRISEYLAKLITIYITDHQKERAAIGTNKLLVYTPSHYRKGSSRPPIALSSNSLDYWLKKLSRPQLKCTAREIRAAVGRAAFAEGLSASEVAAKLGNTAQIAEAHYNYLPAQSEADLYDKFYRKIFFTHAGIKDDYQSFLEKKELYGSCNKADNSFCNQNRCETCPQRIICKTA